MTCATLTSGETDLTSKGCGRLLVTFLWKGGRYGSRQPAGGVVGKHANSLFKYHDRVKASAELRNNYLMNSFGRCVIALALLTAACGDDRTTTPLPRPDTPPARLLTFNGTLQPGGNDSYPFAVAQSGDVQVTLIGAALEDATSSNALTVGLGIGAISSGGSCLLTYSVNATGGTKAQIIGTGQIGSLCVSIFDVGNLTGPAIYTITVATP